MIAIDSTVLVAVCLLGRMDIVERLFGAVTISGGSYDEAVRILRRLAPDAAPPDEERLEVRPVDITGTLMSVSETETLALCREPDCRLLLSDDVIVREEAEKDRVRGVGTVGLLYAATERGLIEDVGEAFQTLRRARYAVAPACEALLRKRLSG